MASKKTIAVTAVIAAVLAVAAIGCIYVVQHGDDKPSEVTVVINANGGWGYDQFKMKVGEEFILPSRSDVSREGYNFLGWSNNKDAVSPTYYPGTTVSVDEDTTFYAVWIVNTIVRECTVTFDYSGLNKTQQMKWNLGSTVQLPDGSDSRYYRPGYILKGWCENSDGSAVVYEAGGDFYVYGSTYLHAIWTEIKSYDIPKLSGDPDFNEQEVSVTIDSVTVHKKTRLSVLQMDGRLLRVEGYAFPSNTAPAVVFKLDGDDITYYNNALQDPQYFRNGGYWNNGTIQKSTWVFECDGMRLVIANDGTLIGGTIHFDNATADFTIDGWYEGTIPKTPVKYTVSFDTGGYGTVDDKSVQRGKTIGMVTDPQRSGYAFIGWTYNGEFWDFEVDQVESDMTLKAYWVEVFTYSSDGNVVTIRFVDDTWSYGLSSIEWGDGKTDYKNYNRETYSHDYGNDPAGFRICVSVEDYYHHYSLSGDRYFIYTTI